METVTISRQSYDSLIRELREFNNEEKYAKVQESIHSLEDSFTDLSKKYTKVIKENLSLKRELSDSQSALKNYKSCAIDLKNQIDSIVKLNIFTRIFFWADKTWTITH